MIQELPHSVELKVTAVMTCQMQMSHCESIVNLIQMSVICNQKNTMNQDFQHSVQFESI
jgi:hypothetical protein